MKIAGRVFFLAALAGFAGLDARGATPRPEPQFAQPDLSEDDVDALERLFQKLGNFFMRGDARAVKTLLAESQERDIIVDTLKREFKEAQYLDFQVKRPIPDNRISPNRHSVDVTIRLKLLYLDDARPPDARKPIENTTFQNFIVQREVNGKFRIVNSSFFDNMGRRSGGMGMFVDMLAIVMLACALLGFGVWMASEAWWIRPRSRWRAVAAIPVIGSLIFFFVCYLPGQWKRKER